MGYTTDCAQLQDRATELTLNGTPIEYGTWIGAFYTDSEGNLSYGGGQVWEGEVTSIAAWGSEAGMNNGFDSGEEFTFGIIDPDSSETIYVMSFSPVNHFPLLLPLIKRRKKKLL